MRLNSISNIGQSVSYDAHQQAVSITFVDGAVLSIPVRLLEMVRYNGNCWETISPTEEELAVVEMGVRGDRIMWDDLGQTFRISDLKAGVYGREAWMQRLSVEAVA